MNATALDLRHFAALLVLLGALVFVHRAPSVPEVGLDEARALIEAGAVVVDVRERSTAAAAHLPGALLIPLEVLASRLGELEAARTKSIVVYCGNGSTRGPRAVQLLNEAGFAGAVNLEPGFRGWRDAGLPTRAS